MILIHDTDSLPAHSTVAAIGMFDGVHLGHLHTLNTLRHKADSSQRQSLVVTFVNHPQHLLQPSAPPVPLIMPVDERLHLLDQAGVDYVLLLSFTHTLARLTATQFMAMLRDRWGVDGIVMGFNHRFGSDRLTRIEDYRHCGATVGIDVVKAPEYPHATVSSSIIRRDIASGDVAAANALMGHPFALEGIVEHGEHLGSALGFPTANVGGFAPHQLLPAAGAYAVRVATDNATYAGMAGVGRRPTVSPGHLTTVEVNLFDCHDTLYGKRLRVEFFEFMRNETKFDNEQQLRQQLEADRIQAIKILTKTSQQ